MFFYEAFNREAQALADRESAILKIMMCFSDSTYQAKPSYDQFEAVVKECEKAGWTTSALYQMFASGRIDPAIDTIIRRYAPTWPPIGKTVEADENPIRMIGE